MTFECDGCGACCRVLIVEIEESDLVREPRLIGRCKPFKIPEGMVLVDEDDNVVEEVVPGYGAGALLACGERMPCPMLGADNRCAIHATKPACCAAFEAGGDGCQAARREAGLPDLPPS